MDIITFLLSLLGALAWLPAMFHFFKKPKLIGRILAVEEQVGTFNGILQNLHFYEINMISLNKSINILDLKIELKYAGIDKIIEGNWYWFNNFTISKFDRIYKLDIPVEQTIPFNGNINNSEMQKTYLTFTTEFNPELENDKLEELLLTFHDAKGKKRKIKLKLNKIKAKQIMWDDAVWKEIS